VLVQYRTDIQSRFLIKKRSSLSHLKVEEKLGHTEQKEVLEDLLGACAIRNKISKQN
jgi:hypothetical protein